MAKVIYAFPIEQMRERLVKHDPKSPVARKKYFRGPDGQIRAEGPNEVYLITNPRDYDKNPLAGGQLRTATIFGQAVTKAKTILRDPEQAAYWTKRWEKQLITPDDDAPIELATGKRHIYARLDKYVQSVLQREMLKEGNRQFCTK